MSLPEKEYFELNEIANRWNCNDDLLIHYFDTGILYPSLNWIDITGDLWNGQTPGDKEKSVLAEKHTQLGKIAYIWNYKDLKFHTDEYGDSKNLNNCILVDSHINVTQWFEVIPYYCGRFLLSEQALVITRKERDRFEKDNDIILQTEINEVMDKTEVYVELTRINSLKECINVDYDFSKLIHLIEELNDNYSRSNYYSTAFLVRAIVDHVPPLFRCNTFNEVYTKYDGSRSFKELMKHLDKSLRKIADSHLHTRIRQHEILPNSTQIDFRAAVDSLLSEIIRTNN